MKGSGIGRSIRAKYRRENDVTYKEKQVKRIKIYKSKPENIIKNRQQVKKFEKTMAEFKNKRCKTCNKLLYYRTKGSYCRKHFGSKK